MKNFDLKKLYASKKGLESERKSLSAKSDEARRLAKLAIFAMQREDRKRADQCLKDSGALVKEGLAMAKKNPLLNGEPGWRSAMEEYAEARLFASYLDGMLEIPKEIENNPDVLLGGISDLAGEIARYSVLRATAKDKAAIEKAHGTVLMIVDALAELDLTGSLRSKFDQSKQHLRKIEDLRYDLSK